MGTITFKRREGAVLLKRLPDLSAPLGPNSVTFKNKLSQRLVDGQPPVLSPVLPPATKPNRDEA
jgi:hypothetical protein